MRQALIRTADTFANPDNRRGYGRIQVLNAINASFVGIDPAPAPGIGARLEVRPNPFAPPAAIEIDVPTAGPLALAVYGADGRLVRVTTRAVRMCA